MGSIVSGFDGYEDMMLPLPREFGPCCMAESNAMKGYLPDVTHTCTETSNSVVTPHSETNSC